MPPLSYITRASSSPRGKPRVWLCCHPADQARLLEPLAKELLEAADCAVWYDPDPAARLSEEEQAEREAALADMQLFVMPVTTRLLTAPSPALDWQFPLAQRLHIPVLPILQEPGLEALFNETCGELQCLDPNQSDPTALPYAEKLKKFLEGVLVGDELAAKVRAAFDAYIFLSYRKKDRCQAQALMHLIHQNDFCRDIAIWYDEFLTPGEDFNAAIAQALDKSRLFVLAVTPNLLEKPNYVMEEEFPRARDGGKAILPVEMAPTDRAALEQAYPGIPACGTPSFPEFFYQLRALLPELAKRERPADPAHNYFIGLAYLAGIDVEVDKKRGVGIIRDAARDGLPEAMEKLADMYRTGEGVKRNYRQAAEWQRKLADARRAAWEARQDENNFRRYAAALWELGDQYNDLADLAAARAVWQEEFLPLTARGMEIQFAAASHFRLLCCNKLGALCQAEGDLAAARRWFEEGLKLARALNGKSSTPQIRRDLAVSCSSLGALCQAEGDLPAARRWFEEGLALFRVLASETGAPEARRDLSISCNKLGALCQAEGDLPAAQRWFEECLELRRALAGETGSPQARRELSVSCNQLGELCRAKGDLAAARRWFGEGLELFRALASETGTPEARRDLSVSCNRLGDLCRATGDLAAARRWFEEGLESARALADETGTPRARQDLSVSCNKLGELCQAEGDLSAARTWFKKSLGLLHTRANEASTLQAQESLLLCCIRLCDLCMTQGDFFEASSWLRQGLKSCGPLFSRAETTQTRRILAIFYGRYGGVFQAEKNFSEAKAWFERSINMYRALASETGTPEARRDLSVSCENLGDLCRETGDMPAAQRWFDESLALRRALAKELGTPQARDDLAVCLYKLGCLPDGDKDLLLESAELWRALSKEIPSVPRYSQYYAAVCTEYAGRSSIGKFLKRFAPKKKESGA